jgi:hypothetical protein
MVHSVNLRECCRPLKPDLYSQRSFALPFFVPTVSFTLALHGRRAVGVTTGMRVYG